MKMETIRPKTFIFDRITGYFKHTDYYGFIHPYNFLEWTSYVREAFFSEKCSGFRVILESPIKMMTAKITATMYHESTFGDTIEARFTTCRIKKCSFDVIIRFYIKKLQEVACETRHTLVFMDVNTQQFSSIPRGIYDAIVEYQESEQR